METRIMKMSVIQRSKFKSYYVVWKRVSPTFLVLSSICLNRTMQYGNFFSRASTSSQLRLFKSYYVVWKLYRPFSHSIYLPRLNRTMQYGNLGVYIFFPLVRQFKSYYVVWKLFFFHRCFVYIMFKSYYVVWKLHG